MSSVITGILSSTAGLLWNKAPDKTATKLQGGDVTDKKIRDLVVREMNDMKIKLHGLSRREDLLSSYSFLQEGVEVLNVALNKLNIDEKASPNETKDDGGEISQSTVGSDVSNDVLKLSYAVGKIKLDSDKEFESAKKRFKDAREKATEAFCNEALSIKDRIFAAKLQIVSHVLECLDSPENAIAGCLLLLKRLHALPALQEIFKVYINGGVRSYLSKHERVENVKSVMMLNCVLFQCVLKLSSSNLALSWPTIELADRSFHPILQWTEISQRKSMRKELDQHLSRLVLDDEIVVLCYIAVNSRGDVVAFWRKNAIKVISRAGETKTVEIPQPEEFDNVTGHSIRGLAFDKNDKVYVLSMLETQTEHDNTLALYTLNENYNVVHTCLLDFLEFINDAITMVVNKSNDIIISQRDNHYVYICDDVGQLKHKFETTTFQHSPTLAISEQNEIITSYCFSKDVKIYTEEGNLKSTIKVPEHHHVMSVAFHHVMCKIIVLSRKDDVNSSCFLLSYTESGELETTTFVCKGVVHIFGMTIRSHPSGPFVVLKNNRLSRITSITFI